MEARYNVLSIFEFQKRFPDEKGCYAYLAKLKLQNGLNCKHCGHTLYCSGNQEFDRQCTYCQYVESVTAGTLIHKVKFSILNAFWIVHYVSTSKKGIASTELSRKLQLRQKTAWLFKQKVLRVMKSSGNQPLVGDVDVDEFVVGQQKEGTAGRQKGKKKLVAIAIEKHGEKGASRMYAREIRKASSSELAPFVREKVFPTASLRTDAWPAYNCLRRDLQNFSQVHSGEKGKNFNTIHRVIMGFKAWLRGIHSHADHLQAYLDEYTYRYNRSFMKEGIFDNLLNRMGQGGPCGVK